MVAPHDCWIFRNLALKTDMKHTKTKQIRNLFFVTSPHNSKFPYAFK